MYFFSQNSLILFMYFFYENMYFPLKILVQVKMQYAMQVSVMLLCCQQQEDITLHLEN